MSNSLRHITGFINVNKEVGASSAQEVSRVKKLAGMPCGHMGTLDPMASGVLPVATGNAARLFDYLLSKRKTYVADFTFGISSDTLDITGNVIKDCGRIPSQGEIEDIIPKFVGEIMQVPPLYSAKNIKGKRGYQLAREGQNIELPPKKVTIYNITIKETVSAGVFRLEIECGGGTYIRSLARDIAGELGTCAAMSALVRTKSGMFTLENSVRTRDLNADNFESYLIPADMVVDFPSVHLTAVEDKKITNGVPVQKGLACGDYKIYLADGSFYGIGSSDGINFKTRTKLC
ncbi:MAG: tRNA pseudouridine(55) synthase TruB [Clostridia bacterium]|nr:tRNA pseudouridine(55) synthase TruB [Clostridia bacterium]